ncbi:MAG: tetratricopeptide repeat protein, partial [Vulcanimicrobiota bacterium]
IESYNQAIELQAQDALAWAGRGYAYLEKGEYEKALSDAEEAVRLNPYLGASYLTRGYAYIRARGDYEKGIADYTKAIELDHEEAKRRGKKISFFYAYVARADAYREIGELEKALKDADQAIEINPAYHLAFFSRGKIHQALGNAAQAAADFDKGVELVAKAKAAEAHTARAWLHMEQKKYDQAVVSYEEALKLEPDSSEAYRGLANVYRAQKKYDKALEAYDKALSLAPSDPYAYSARAGLKIDMKKWAEAMEDFNRSLELSPRFASGYYARAELHLARGDKAEALEDYKKALEYAPDQELKKLAGEKIEKLSK